MDNARLIECHGFIMDFEKINSILQDSLSQMLCHLRMPWIENQYTVM